MGERAHSHDVPSLGSTLWAGIAGRCPSCHRGKLYSGYLTEGKAAVYALEILAI